MTSQRTPHVTLYGNLGADPETRTLPGRTITRDVYDAIIDETLTREYITQDRELRTASLAVNAKDEHGEDLTRWIRLVDFNDHLTTYRKGDRIKVRGYFKTRQYTKDNEVKTIREFVVTAAELQTMKIRQQAA
jgi:single-stranded DNA-binding protein